VSAAVSSPCGGVERRGFSCPLADRSGRQSFPRNLETSPLFGAFPPSPSHSRAVRPSQEWSPSNCRVSLVRHRGTPSCDDPAGRLPVTRPFSSRPRRECNWLRKRGCGAASVRFRPDIEEMATPSSKRQPFALPHLLEGDGPVETHRTSGWQFAYAQGCGEVLTFLAERVERRDMPSGGRPPRSHPERRRASWSLTP
jgi:hypothetical protein